ncbi:MAG: PQQ-binding-like beta-propeller repeat protein [Gemmataceae bacterium]
MNQILLCLLALLVAGASVRADNWPAWRGPRGDGTSNEKNLPIHWDAKKNVTWKVPVAGIGHSSPIVWESRIFVTSCLEDSGKRVLICFDRDNGKQLWQRVVVESPLERKHSQNSRASSTPATDGKYVFVTFLDITNKKEPTVQVACYDFDGKKIWQKSPGAFFSRHGFCSTPVLYKDKVIVNCDQDAIGKYRAYIVALDKATGKEHWRIDRPNRTRSYCAPLIRKASGKMQLVLSGSLCITSYDPDTGKLHWIVNGPTEQYVASPVWGEGVFFVTTGFPQYHNIAIRPDGEGDVTNSHVVWHEKRVSKRDASYVPSPIAWGKYFFLVSDVGLAHCFDAKTGKRLWANKLGKFHRSSPVEANGLLYFLDDRGTTHVVKASRKFEVVARNGIGEKCYASPAISDGQIFIRSWNHLWCIGLRTFVLE